MKLLKTSLFTFICALIIFVTIYFTGVELLWYLFGLAVAMCFCTLIAWVCTKIFHRFKYSLNVIIIFILGILTLLTSFIKEDEIHISKFRDIMLISIESGVWIITTLACVVSILVLIGRIIFSSHQKEEQEVTTNLQGMNKINYPESQHDD